MRYLKLMADYTQFPLLDEFGEGGNEDVHTLPDGMVEKLIEWNERYRKLLPLDCDHATLLRGQQLDKEGQILAQEIESLFTGEVKVRYVSAL
jgi:hypothetical protein